MVQLLRFKLLEAAYLKAKRQELSLQEKIEVLDQLKKKPPNSGQRELAEILTPRRNLNPKKHSY